MANDDSQTEENTSDDSDEDAPENPRKCFAVDRLERCLRALRGTVTLGIAQTGMLTLSTEDAFYMQTQLRITASKTKPARKKAAKAA